MSGLFPEFCVGRRPVLAMILVTSIVLASCAAPPPGGAPKGDRNNPWIVKINFQAGSNCKIASVTAEANACGLPASDICVVNSKFLRWESNPENVGFEVYFDPLQGGPVHRAPNGKKRVQIASKGRVPPVFFKYAILGLDNCDPVMDTVDPRIRVDN